VAQASHRGQSCPQVVEGQGKNRLVVRLLLNFNLNYRLVDMRMPRNSLVLGMMMTPSGRTTWDWLRKWSQTAMPLHRRKVTFIT
jgi:hypothetical protein